MLFPFSLAGAARRWLEKEPPRSILTWEDLVSKFINEFFPPSRTTNLRNEISNFQQRFDESFHEAWDRYKDLLRACPHHGFTELHQLDTFYNALNPADQDSLNSAAGGNLLERSTQDVLTIIENKSKVRNSRNKSIVSQVKSSDATLPPASVKAVEEICVTCGGAHPYYQCLVADGNTFPEYRDNIQGYVAATAGNYNQGNASYRPPSVVNQTRPSGFVQQNWQNNQNHLSQPQGYNRGNNFNQNSTYQAPIQQNQSVPLSELEKIKKMNDVNIKVMQAQINNVKNELRNEMQSSIQASMSNQTNELKNMMASFFQMNTASTSGTGSLPSNIVANPKGELKAITTRSGLVLDGPTVPMHPPFINPEETLTDPEHGEYTIKEKQKEKDEVQIHKFWHMFKQLHINISLADALILIPKYQKMLKSLLSNKEKLIELANTPLNENCSAVILKKLPEKLGDPGKFLILCGFSELKCKALADLGASINVMTLSVWKKLGLPELISTQMTLELVNRDICTPKGIARDVFVPVVDFVIVDYERDPLVPPSLVYNNRSGFVLDGPSVPIPHPFINPEEDECIEETLTGPDLTEFTIKSDNDDVYNDPFDSKEDKVNVFLIDELDLPGLSYFLPFLKCDSVFYENFSEVDALSSTNNEDKVFNPGILIHENLFKVTNCETMEKNIKKTTNASLILEDFNPPLYELPFHKEVPGLGALLSFLSENEEKVFNPGIITSKRVHSSLLPELSHRGPKAFKDIKILESPMEIFPCSYGEDIRALDVPCLHFYPP
ncbi:reverse transcriptase domain-containing protein [Tanacetum coccineum]